MKTTAWGTRPAFHRLSKIDAQIQRGTVPNASVLAREFGVCPKTIQRDIAFLREQGNRPIIWLVNENRFDTAQHFMQGDGI